MNEFTTPHLRKKSLGQHFLHQSSVIEAIAQSMDPGFSILEIGPGRGALTQVLKKRFMEMAVLEKDSSLQNHLEAILPKEKIFWGNATDTKTLKKALGSLHPKNPLGIISNLPYNDSAPIFIQLLQMNLPIQAMTLMFQKEVGERIQTGPGTKKFGSLSVLAQSFFEVEKFLLVRPGAFQPPPKVHSVVLKFTRRENPLFPQRDFLIMEKLLRAAFSHRRKTIKKSLLYAIPALNWEMLLKKAQVNPGLRAEAVDLGGFLALKNALPPSFASDFS